MGSSEGPSRPGGAGLGASFGPDMVRARPRCLAPAARSLLRHAAARAQGSSIAPRCAVSQQHRGPARHAKRVAARRVLSRRAERGLRAQEASFREFCSRPENKPLVEKTQKREIRTAQRLQNNEAAERFRQRFMDASPEAQAAMAPFLKVPLLRRIVQTLTNDERNDFGRWATNPAVIELLTAAKDAIDSGRMSEGEAEQLLLAHAKARDRHTRALRASLGTPRGQGALCADASRAQDPKLNPEAEAFKERVAMKARLDTAQLVGALNEQLGERAAGNRAYRAGRFDEALEAYTRALAILDFVAGVSAADQEEVLKNKGVVLWNMAAAHLGRAEYGAAVTRCTDALALKPPPEPEMEVKLLLRRAKAHAARRDFQLARADLDAVKAIEPWNFEAEDVAAHMRRLRAKDADADKAFAAAAMRAAAK